MKFIDHIRKKPICFNGSTHKFDYDATPLIERTTVFDVTQVARQLIQSHTRLPGGWEQTLYTQKGLELLKYDSHKHHIDVKQYVGIMPPFSNCWFEYLTTDGDFPNVAVHLASLTKEQIVEEFPGEPYAFLMFATVFIRYVMNGVSECCRETVATIAADEEGGIQALNINACLPPTADPSLPQNQPHYTPLLVMLVSLMLMHCQVVKSTLSPEIVMSRQQRRYEKRNPARVQAPLFRYYTLSLDAERYPHRDRSGKGGWEQAWHVVRGHLRRLKSGKIVPVRPHSRGSSLKGVIFKDYAVSPSSSMERKAGTG